MNDPAAPIPLLDRLAGLAAFLPVFEAEDFQFGSWHSEPHTLPMYQFSDDASRFVETVYQLGWINPDFDWMTWGEGPEARRLLDDPEALANADAAALGRLLMAHIRQERFCDRHLATQFERGHLAAILRRARALHTEMQEVME